MGLKDYIILALIIVVMALYGLFNLFKYKSEVERDKRDFIEGYYEKGYAEGYGKIFNKKVDSVAKLIGVGNKRISEVTKLNTRYETYVNRELIDTVLFKDTIKYVDYDSNGVSLKGFWGKGKYPKMVINDSVEIVLYDSVVKRFLFIPVKRQKTYKVLSRYKGRTYSTHGIRRVKKR